MIDKIWKTLRGFDYDAFMRRPTPLWVVLFLIFFGAMFTVSFGWAVKSTLAGSERAGFFGEAAVAIASFPTKAKDVLLEVSGYASGDYKDEAIRIRRDPSMDYSGFAPLPAAPGLDVEGLLFRADRAAIAAGWRLLVGAFSIAGAVENAALMISPDLEIVHVWILDEIPVDEIAPRPKYRKFIHGLEILDDASLIFTFDGGVSLQRFDRCGARLWSVGGYYHHAVTLDDEGGSVWTFDAPDVIARVAAADGATLQRISMDEIIAANPMIDIFEIRRRHDSDLGVNSRNTAGAWMEDPFHLNDVEPLPAAIAKRFDGFEAGDLLVSARSLNLIFVLDPATREVKWWRVGATQRQHDPDWLPSGEISIFNNRMSRGYSEIIALDPRSLATRRLFDGRVNDFYTRIRGKHQMTDSGALVVTSPQQGRAFEVDRTGAVVLEIVNVKPGDATTNYVMSELRWAPPDRFNPGMLSCEN